MSQPSAGAGQVPSFKTNVDRVKSKRWVQAPSYSYDGDDWGGADEYEEYDGYEEPAPPPPKPTGFRQRGQSASQGSTEPSLVQAEHSRLQPGDVRPSNVSQSQGTRSFTSPQAHSQPALARQNSFDPDEERRAFSGPQVPHPPNSGFGQPQQATGSQGSQGGPYGLQPMPAERTFTPPALQGPPPGQVTQPPILRRNEDEQSRLPGRSQGLPSSSELRGPSALVPGQQPSTGSRTQSMTSSTSFPDPHNRRDFATPTISQPPQTRGSPSPQRADFRPPPRKSSLGQDSAPTAPILHQTPMVISPTEIVNSPQAQRERSASGPQKTLPFVRPADIYKRMEEEREKERRSQDSSRPSLDSLIGKPKERPSIDTGRDSDGSQRLKPALDPVKERKSEYLAEGTPQNLQTKNRDSQSSVRDFRPSDRDSGPIQSFSNQRDSQSTITSEVPTMESTTDKRTSSKRFEIRRPSSTSTNKSALGPVLPEVSRISGFGESFGDSFMGPSSGFSKLSSAPGEEKAPSQAEQVFPSTVPDRRVSDLQHQPSLGFTSVVHQSFDNAQEQVPPTPSSTADSSVERSTSGGTSTVSPIISRGPSSATQGLQNPLPGIEDVSSPDQQPPRRSFGERPISSSSKTTLTQRKSQNLSQEIEDFDQSPPPPFIPGHRRDMSTPSPDNSPARTPAVETSRQIRRPEEVELATTTPTTTDTDLGSEKDFDRRDSGLREETPTQTSNEVTKVLKSNKPYPQDGSGSKPFPQIRSTSPDKGKVQNLASKFEDPNRSDSPRSLASKGEVLSPPRPSNERAESFRPQIPGGWQSSTSIMPVDQTRTSATPYESHQGSESTSNRSPHPGDTAKDSPSESKSFQAEDVSRNAFAAAATAGSALAGALVAAVGGGQKQEDENKPKVEQVVNAPERSYTANHGLPESLQNDLRGKPSDIPKPLVVESKASSAAPSPLPKDTPTKLTEEPTGNAFFSESASESKSNPVQAATIATNRGPRTHSPQPPPAIDTDLRGPRYESDRLRREIVRELSPGVGSDPTTAESDSPYQVSSKYSTTPGGGPRSEHESGTISKVHHNYWSDDDSESEPEKADARQNQYSDPALGASQLNESAQIPETAVGSQISDEASVPPRHLPHRFSWEQPLQDLGPVPSPSQEAQHAPLSSPTRNLTDTAGPQANLQEPSDYPETARSSTVVETSTIGLSDSIRKPPVVEKDISEAPESVRTESDHDRNVESRPDGLEVAAPVTEKETVEPVKPGSIDLSQGGDSPSELGDTTPSRQFQALPTPAKSIEQPTPNAAPVAQPKIPPFREILALKSPAERIRAYNETRLQFANLDTGLSQWLFITTNELPEHADLVSNQGRTATFSGHKASPSRSKFGGIIASGPDSGSPGVVASSQAYVPSGGSGGKISGQQVQAKSKELLHSAGIFGGKANVAAKGLFSKGKSKLRGSSGADKV